MTAYDNLHSRVVAWLKVILPLMALALMATLFLVARLDNPDTVLPFSKRTLEEMANEQRVDSPEFSGVTEEGRSIEISALSATPRDGDYNVVDANEVHGRMETGDGGSIEVSSETGTVFAKTSRVTLRGGVTVTTSTGYTIRTDQLESSLDQTQMETTAEVSADGPLGKIDAGRLVVIPAEDGSDDVSVVFKDGVKLIYTPQNQ